MRLLDAKTLRLREFFGSDIPPYAILSHTWGSVEDEVSFQDISNLTHEVRQKPGFQKIAYTAQQAQRDDLDWVWVDTCCIDKTSSAELSEAINSMYNWYNRSSRCYAYLSDVVPWPGSSQDDLWSSRMFENSRWFTRGWTLQELIAPLWVAFYAQDWTFINNKARSLWGRSQPSDRLWSKVLTDITGIPTQLLFTEKEVAEYSVAQRMSWAANRACTRVEDVAYSLLGLFGINMPLLYGEESKAFERLQEEILKTIDDHSLFASVPMDESNERSRYQIVTSILARSPRDFRQSSDVVRNGEELGEPSQITKHGLRIQLPLRKVRFSNQHHLFWTPGRFETYLAGLNCDRDGDKVHLLLLRDNSIADTRGSHPHHRRFYRLGTSAILNRCPDGVTISPDEDVELLYIRKIIPTDLLKDRAPSIRCITFQTNVSAVPTFLWPDEESSESYKVEEHDNLWSRWSHRLDRFLPSHFPTQACSILRLGHGWPEMPPVFLMAATEWQVLGHLFYIALFRGSGDHARDFSILGQKFWDLDLVQEGTPLEPDVMVETGLRLGTGKYIQAKAYQSRGPGNAFTGSSKHIVIAINTWIAQHDITAQEDPPRIQVEGLEGSVGRPVQLGDGVQSASEGS